MSRPHLKPLLAAVLALFAIAVGPAVAEQAGTPEVVISFDGRISPRQLPRDRAAPVSLELSGGVTGTEGNPPPQLQRIELAFGARGGLDTAGLPVCPRSRLRNATQRQALARCRGALVGRGEIGAEVPLNPADPIPARADVLVFNGRTSCAASRNSDATGSSEVPHPRTRRKPIEQATQSDSFAQRGRRSIYSGGDAALIQNQPFLNPQSQSDSSWGLRKGPAEHAQGSRLQSPLFAGRLWPSRSRTQGGRQGERTPVRDPRAADRGRRDAPCHSRPAAWVHAYSASPPVSFVLPFHLRRRSTGTYGVLMRSPVRRALGRWPRLRSFEITLGRRYRAAGERRSYLNARCPLPPRFNSLSVPVARATYYFAPRPTLTQPILRRCSVRP